MPYKEMKSYPKKAPKISKGQGIENDTSSLRIVSAAGNESIQNQRRRFGGGGGGAGGSENIGGGGKHRPIILPPIISTT